MSLILIRRRMSSAESGTVGPPSKKNGTGTCRILGNVLEPARAEPISAVLVFLHSLERHTRANGEVRLGHVQRQGAPRYTVLPEDPPMRFTASGGGGDEVGFYGQVIVPVGYQSNAALSNTTVWDNATFASLAVAPGTYVWTWGTGPDQGFTVEIATTPLPATLPLFATVIGAFGLLSWRGRRRAQSVVRTKH